ncbi:hypothetical protein DFH28DRAFT_1082322 [Melampsora americana]|nr:hypothetical protein DFH28DRAFT_1082322 [Melampsora americana]
MPHSTLYWEPRPPHLSHLIGTRCNLDPGYFRYYNKAKLCQDLLAHNHQLRLFAISSTSLNSNVARVAMMDPQLTLNAIQTSSIVSAPFTRPIPMEVCQGHHGEFAPLHSSRMNRACPIKACYECCNKLGNLPCVPHETQARKKTRGAASNVIETPQPTQHATDTPPVDNTSAPTTQAGRTYTRRLSATELLKFQSISLLKQADEQVQNDEIALAKKIVTMVVWAGAEHDPFGSETWRVQAPKWPLFSLNQSEEFLSLVERQLGPGWTGGIRVWNHEECNWVHIKLTTIELYPKECKKILVIFPGIKATQCEDVDHHLASIAPMSAKAAMDIQLMITPKSSNAHTSNAHTPNSITPYKAQQISSGATTPTHISDSEDERDASTMKLINEAVSQALTDPEVEPTSSSPHHNRRGQRWPRGVNIQSMLVFYERSLGKRISMKAAWEEQFKHSYTYASSTVSTYCCWAKSIGVHRLTEYVENHPDHTVHQAKDYFDDDEANRPMKRTRGE